jgi:Lysine-specific metallo-endopeptidase
MPKTPVNKGFDELVEELDLGHSELGELGVTRMVNPAKVDCERLDRSLPIFRAIGTTDPVGVLEAVCQRAVAMLDNTIAELTRIRERVRAGEEPGSPLIGDRLGWLLQTRMLMRVNESAAWTRTGPRTAGQIIRWLTNIRNTIANGSLSYTCLASDCDPHPTRWAFTFPNRLIIGLCRNFWRPKQGVDAATQLEFQAQTIIHEVAHIYYDLPIEVGRGPGVAECISQFIADFNGSPIDPDFVGSCGPSASEAEEELLDYGRRAEAPTPWPQWPPSRSFNPPPPRTIPTGPFQTFSPCDAVTDDAIKLSLAVDDLKNQLRQKPPNLRQVNNRSDVVRALNRQILARLQQLTYVQAGCSREDLGLLARSVAAMRGRGADADIGSWPPAAFPAAQEPRRAARESLGHLLAWVRRAERKFPRI